MKVLVVNCGSSSLKYQLIDSKSESVLASGLCERIGIDGVLNHTPAGHDKIVMTDPLPDHQTAISKVLRLSPIRSTASSPPSIRSRLWVTASSTAARSLPPPWSSPTR